MPPMVILLRSALRPRTASLLIAVSVACLAMGSFPTRASAQAQPETGTSSRAPATGDSVRVRLWPVEAGPEPRPIHGWLVRLDADSIALAGASRRADAAGVYRAPRRDIARVEVSAGTRRNTARGAIAGAVIGAAIGAVSAFAVDRVLENCGLGASCEGARSSHFVMRGSLTGGLIGAGAGAGIGALMRTQRWRALPLPAPR